MGSSDTGSLNKLKTASMAVASLAIIDMMAIAVIIGFKTTNLVSNAVADAFVAGLTIFATFIGVIILAIIGKSVISLFSGSDM
jgi:hypothetical protein